MQVRKQTTVKINSCSGPETGPEYSTVTVLSHTKLSAKRTKTLTDGKRKCGGVCGVQFKPDVRSQLLCSVGARWTRAKTMLYFRIFVDNVK